MFKGMRAAVSFLPVFRRFTSRARYSLGNPPARRTGTFSRTLSRCRTWFSSEIGHGRFGYATTTKNVNDSERKTPRKRRSASIVVLSTIDHHQLGGGARPYHARHSSARAQPDGDGGGGGGEATYLSYSSWRNGGNHLLLLCPSLVIALAVAIEYPTLFNY